MASDKYRVRITLRSLADVESALHWFREQNAEAAGARWFLRLMAAIEALERNPQRYGLAAESAEIELPIRELIVGRRRSAYRVLFEIRGRTVVVLRVWHAARRDVTGQDL